MDLSMIEVRTSRVRLLGNGQDRGRGKGAFAEVSHSSAWGGEAGPGEKIPRTVTRVERYPEAPGVWLGTSGFAVERAAAPRGFVLREMGECVPPNRHPLCPCFLPRRGEGKEQNGIFLGGKYI